jgi:c-di-GMP-binding flagellar brake protein YcgR
MVKLFPLQIKASDFTFGKSSGSTENIVIVVIIAVVFLVIIIRAVKQKSSGKKPSSGKKSSFFSGFAIRRIGRNIGLNHNQIKMLDFALKTDDVKEPEKSINTPALLDRHFKRAYRVIEQSASTDEDAQHRFAILFSTRNMLENSSNSSLNSTRQLQDDAVLTINSGKEKFQVPVISTKSDHLSVECPKTVLGSQIKLPRGEKMTVFFFTKNNKGFSFETKVVGYSSTRGLPSLLLAHSNNLKFLSQRRFRRKQTVIACFLNMVYPEGEGKKQRLVVDKRRLAGNIADISIGGCSIKTAAPIQGGARLKVEFKQGKNNVAVLGQVLRTNRAGSSTIIHMKFLKITRKSMNIINAFVYEYAHE